MSHRKSSHAIQMTDDRPVNILLSVNNNLYSPYHWSFVLYDVIFLLGTISSGSKGGDNGSNIQLFESHTLGTGLKGMFKKLSD